MSQGKPNKSNAWSRFISGEGGGFIIFSLFIFVCQLLIVGLAIDVVRTENMRTQLQNVSDAAVLAAADLDQTLDETAVVTDYFTRMGLEDHLTGVTVSKTVNSKSVTAHANADVPSMFLNMVGINSLGAPAVGTAIEGITDVEVSLVVDISGSMRDGTKMADLRHAASLFVDMTVDDGKSAGVSLSVVPYTAQVNAGAAIMDQMNVNRIHNYSSCVEFEPADFTTTDLSLVQSYDHMQHFEWSAEYGTPISNPTCPQQSFEEITAFSENIAALKADIAQFVPRSNTAIHIGMKWGVALLDPTSRPMVNQLIALGEASSTFSDRPYHWDRPDTLKILVVMTDGLNVATNRVHDYYYDSQSEIELWAEKSLGRIADESGIVYTDLVYEKYSPTQADSMLLDICAKAKERGIIIYAVGLEVTEYSKQLLSDCSSAAANYFGVNSAGLDDAFAAIAQQINALRLTQ